MPNYEGKKYHTYKAVYGKKGDFSILRVGAVNLKDAKLKIKNQLNRPGRFNVYRLWKQHGSQIVRVVKDDDTSSNT